MPPKKIHSLLQEISVIHDNSMMAGKILKMQKI